MLINSLYLDCCEVLLESGGLQTGLLTVSQFLDFYVATMNDFLGETGIIKAIGAQGQQYGQQQYDVPDWIGDIEACFSDGSTLFRDVEQSIASRNRNWRSEIGACRSWRQDKEPMDTVSVYPGPKLQGQAGGPDPGIVVAWVPGGASQVQAFIGTLSQSGQVATFASPGTFFAGVNPQPIAQFSRKNICMVGQVVLFSNSVQLGDSIESLPDDFVIFIKYGILSRVWSVDGENKDPQRARYCMARYQEGVSLGKAVMGEELEAA